MVEVSRHFALEVIVCPLHGTAAAAALRVAATMPEHGHGMNYAPSVRRLGEHRFRAEGLLFHMPGRWRLEFELHGEAGPQRVVHELLVR